MPFSLETILSLLQNSLLSRQVMKNSQQVCFERQAIALHTVLQSFLSLSSSHDNIRSLIRQVTSFHFIIQCNLGELLHQMRIIIWIGRQRNASQMRTILAADLPTTLVSSFSPGWTRISAYVPPPCPLANLPGLTHRLLSIS